MTGGKGGATKAPKVKKSFLKSYADFSLENRIIERKIKRAQPDFFMHGLTGLFFSYPHNPLVLEKEGRILGTYKLTIKNKLKRVEMIIVQLVGKIVYPDKDKYLVQIAGVSDNPRKLSRLQVWDMPFDSREEAQKKFDEFQKNIKKGPFFIMHNR